MLALLYSASAFAGAFFGVRVRLPEKVKAELTGLARGVARTVAAELVQAHADECARRANAKEV